MSAYKLFCINLKRRDDRRQRMIKQFQKAGVTKYSFFEAVDGYHLNLNDPDFKYFKHNNQSMLRKGIVGCALSHYKLWKMLMNDPEVDYYVVLEDDIEMRDNFTTHVQNFLQNLEPDTDILYMGMSVERKDYEKSRAVYQYDTSYTIHPLARNWYAGGLFCYLITKKGANKLYNYIQKNGIKMVIDYLTFRAPINTYETHPHLAFTESVQHSDHDVDSDVQKDFSKITIDLVDNDEIFDDYLFCPNQDSVGNDIMQIYADVKTLKEAADSIENCVAFNTYGWLKYALLPEENFTRMENKFHRNDGIYIKKKYLALISNKPLNCYQFDDYIFYSGRDSPGNNIMHYPGDILFY